jgi:hypothetical protein
MNKEDLEKERFKLHQALCERNETIEELQQRIDKVLGMLEFYVFNGERPLTISELNKLYYILKGSEE